MSDLDRALCYRAPNYPGDSVLILELVRRNGSVVELGSVRVQWFKDDAIMVASYTPGYVTHFDGDSPKMNPDECVWVQRLDEAWEFYARQIANAFRTGWRIARERK